VVPGESQGFLGDLKNTINKATDIANSLGTSGEGKVRLSFELPIKEW
jgi:hypothetical protein